MSEEDHEPDVAPGTARPAPLAPLDPLRRASDQAVRPGFRSPANTRSKAQQKSKKKK